MTALALALLVFSAAPTARSAPKQALADLEQAAPDAPRVYAGMYLSDVSGFDLREGRFQADLDLWLKWSGPPEPPVLRFVNGEIESKEEQERESDGDWHSVRWRVQGTFRGTFPLQAFPFDRQQIELEIALPEDTAHLLPDLASSGMARQFSITGWEYEPFFRAESGKDLIASDLGSIKQEGRSRTLESVKFIVDLRRPRTSNVLKFMLPLAIILAMAFLVFALPPAQLDARGAMGVTALLSVVAFHFAMSGSLPDVPYLVAADRFFLASYVLVLVSIVETVLVFRMDQTKPLPKRIDRLSAIVLSAVAVIVGSSVVTIPLRQQDHLAEDQLHQNAPIPPRPAPFPSARDELRVGVSSLSSLNANGLSALLRRGLTQVDGDGTLQPHLAAAIPAMTDESVRLLPDGGMLVQWRLRPGLKWSDGKPVSSRDLVYSLGLISDPDRTDVRAVDEHTVQIRYARRLADALTDFAIYPEHVGKPVSADGGMEAIRSRNQTEPLPNDGPFRLASFTANKEAVFERNEHFAGTRPAIARLRVLVRSPEEMVAGLKDHTLDFVPVLPGAIADPVRALPDAAVKFALDDTLLYLHPDLNVPLLADPRMRRALLLALDREAIARVYVDGNGRAAHTFRPQEAPDFATDAAQVAYSPAEARKLLAELGEVPPLKLTLVEMPAGSGYARAAELIRAQLEAAGLKLEVISLPSTKVFESVNRSSHGGLVLHTRRDVRPARFFNLPTQAGGVLDTRTPRPHFPQRLIALNQMFETSLFPERRRLISMRLQREFAERLPVIPIAFGAQLSAYSQSLAGFDGAGQSGSLWWNVESWALKN